MNREHPSHLNASVLTFNSIILLILWFFDCVQCSFACFITFAFQCVISQHVKFVVCFTAIDIQWNFLCLYDLDSRINWKFKIDVVLINWMYRWLNPHLKKKKPFECLECHSGESTWNELLSIDSIPTADSLVQFNVLLLLLKYLCGYWCMKFIYKYQTWFIHKS